MTDIFNKEARCQIMSAVRAKNTKPELIARKLIHSMGFRFRLHRKDLPGCPDIVLPKHRKVIIVNGCFWHCHNCDLFKWPKSNVEFWKDKLTKNRKRDKLNIQALIAGGWQVVILWECAIKGKSRLPIDQLGEKLQKAILEQSSLIEIQGC